MNGKKFHTLYPLAEEHGGYFLAAQALDIGINKATLLSMHRRGTLERVSRGVYKLTNFPISPLAHYIEANLWPSDVTAVISHQSALALYNLSDVNPSHVHVTVPKKYRIRRAIPKYLKVHHMDISQDDVQTHQGVVVTKPVRTIRDCFAADLGPALLRQAIDEGRRSGHLTMKQADELTKEVL
jgi:predicted transcriptional regulator of viral defense system